MPLGNQGNVIRLSKSCLSSAEKAAVMATLDREFLGMGAEVQEFERELSSFFGRPALCVTNGTAALQLALQAAGVGAGDEGTCAIFNLRSKFSSNFCYWC